MSWRALAALVGASALGNVLMMATSLAPPAEQVRPGVWAAADPQALPLPLSGYQAYLVGEMHGLEEDRLFQLQYLTSLHARGLRDVAIEEDGVYQDAASDYIGGRSASVPRPLCLRAGVLDGIRRFNANRSDDERVRVHLVDIDSPLAAIRAHLLAIRDVLKASDVVVPDEGSLKQRGLGTVTALRQRDQDARAQTALRTVELSIRASQDGFLVDLGPSEGSPYLESRETAVASNIIELLRGQQVRSVLVLYGADHVARTTRRDGGPDRNQPWTPMSLRLRQAGIKAASIVTYPLNGHTFWRGRRSALPWTAADGHLTSGETLDRLLLAAPPDAKFFYVERNRERISLPSQDFTKMDVEGYVLFRSGTAMADRCR